MNLSSNAILALILVGLAIAVLVGKPLGIWSSIGRALTAKPGRHAARTVEIDRAELPDPDLDYLSPADRVLVERLRATGGRFPKIDAAAWERIRHAIVTKAEQIRDEARRTESRRLGTDPRRDMAHPDHPQWVMEAHRPCTDASCEHPSQIRDQTVHCAYCGERMPCGAIALRAGLDADRRNLNSDWRRALGFVPRQQDRSSNRWW